MLTAPVQAVSVTGAAAAVHVTQAVPMGSDRGSLKVVAKGVPQGRSPKITVAGKKYRKKLPSAGKLRNLRPGTYRVWAAPIVADGGTAAVQGLPVRIKVRTRKPSVLRLAYTWNPKNDSYPPGPASDLQVTQRTTDSISLRWTNGQAPDLQSVAVRRKQGQQPPQSLDDGQVVPVDTLGATVTDTGLRSHTAYSYSVFMVDIAGNTSKPAQIATRTAGRAKALSAGISHTCALLQDSAAQPGTDGNHVQCWGDNSRGQLGHGPGADSPQPQPVELPDAVQVVAGAAHTCARQENGAVWCWGANDHGQLGDGSTDDAAIPVRVDIPGAVDVAAGGDHTCAVLTTGSVRCWGANDHGQAGGPGAADQVQPVTVPGLTGTASLEAGHAHTCAVHSNGSVRCWGANDHGQLGNGSRTDSATPVRVTLPTAAGITAGVFHTCALHSDQTVSCWGANEYGQLGDATTTERLTATSVPALVVTSLSAGAYHTCAALKGGGARCWGRNATGRIGDGTILDRWQPTRVFGITTVSSLAAGGYHSCAVTPAGAHCWGYNGSGQLGTGGTSSSLRPAPVVAL
jgi:alpha-tubulin suppressor-like RCC1 family protein